MSDGLILLIGVLAGLAAGICIAGGWRACILRETEVALHRAQISARNIVGYLEDNEPDIALARWTAQQIAGMGEG